MHHALLGVDEVQRRQQLHHDVVHLCVRDGPAGRSKPIQKVHEVGTRLQDAYQKVLMIKEWRLGGKRALGLEHEAVD